MPRCGGSYERGLFPPRLTLPLLDGALPRSIVPRGALPVPAHGGRSLWVIVVPRGAAPELPPFDGRFEELPPEAQQYVKRLETLVGAPIKMVSVGPERTATLLR